jgi:hypothetical protein
MKSDKPVLADVRLTLRLSRELDARMRASADFFGRSVGAEWRAAAELCRRVLAQWPAAAVADTHAGHEVAAAARTLLELCDGLVSIPPSLDALRGLVGTSAEGGE